MLGWREAEVDGGGGRWEGACRGGRGGVRGSSGVLCLGGGGAMSTASKRVP